MAFVNRERETWSGEGDEISNKKKKKTKSDERLRMDDMEERYQHRKERIDFFNERVRKGQKAKADRIALARKEYVQAERRKKLFKIKQIKSCVAIQRVTLTLTLTLTLTFTRSLTLTLTLTVTLFCRYFAVTRAVRTLGSGHLRKPKSVP